MPPGHLDARQLDIPTTDGDQCQPLAADADQGLAIAARLAPGPLRIDPKAIRRRHLDLRDLVPGQPSRDQGQGTGRRLAEPEFRRVASCGGIPGVPDLKRCRRQPVFTAEVLGTGRDLAHQGFALSTRRFAALEERAGWPKPRPPKHPLEHRVVEQIRNTASRERIRRLPRALGLKLGLEDDRRDPQGSAALRAQGVTTLDDSILLSVARAHAGLVAADPGQRRVLDLGHLDRVIDQRPRAVSAHHQRHLLLNHQRLGRRSVSRRIGIRAQLDLEPDLIAGRAESACGHRIDAQAQRLGGRRADPQRWNL